MSKLSEQSKRHKKVLKASLLKYFNNECFFCKGILCNNVDLEFAHIKPDKMNGDGRGSYKRLTWIKNHLNNFWLLGNECHIAYDLNGNSDYFKQ